MFGDTYFPQTPMARIDSATLYQHLETYLQHNPKHSLRWFASTNFYLPIKFSQVNSKSPELLTIEGLKAIESGNYAQLHLQFSMIDGASKPKVLVYCESVQVCRIDKQGVFTITR
jgi:hypothetical protein